MTGLLTHDDLVQLTDYRRPADQRRWLDKKGIPYWIGARGRPKVLWSALDESRPNPQKGERPDWSAIR